MSLVARVVRSFAQDAELVTLERAVPLPALPTMGSRPDLRAFGVETPLSVVGITLRAVAGGPGVREPDADVHLAHEPLANAPFAGQGGWRSFESR